MDNKECISRYKVLQECVFLNMPCPRCGRQTMRAEKIKNSLSRYEDIYICPHCGSEEAFNDFEGKEFPLDDWYAIKLFNKQNAIYTRSENSNKPHFKLNVRAGVWVSGKDIDDILCDAFEGGVTSMWCGGVEVVGEKLGEYAFEQISRGGSLMIIDDETGKKYELNLDNFMRGLQMFLQEDFGPYVYEGKVDPGTMDAIVSDCELQYAIFGEAVYG